MNVLLVAHANRAPYNEAARIMSAPAYSDA